ncbi:hypothetical protein [Rhodoferax ferrireducens]|uniref:hypothetical protein n=1 Tax=Rhodoferax ferrireducens TaxID=192843 RepID=UPI00140FD66B|nr:hypothetical protein [Rhodoferax ferrireducens]
MKESITLLNASKAESPEGRGFITAVIVALAMVCLLGLIQSYSSWEIGILSAWLISALVCSTFGVFCGWRVYCQVQA